MNIKIVATAAVAIATVITASEAKAGGAAEARMCEYYNMHTNFISEAENRTYLALCHHPSGYQVLLGNYDNPGATTILPIASMGDGYFEGEDRRGDRVYYDPGCSPDNLMDYCNVAQPPTINLVIDNKHHKLA